MRLFIMRIFNDIICTNMNTQPKVRFKSATIEEETNMLFHFCCGRSAGGWDWSEKVYRVYPDLKEKLAGKDNKDDQYSVCKKYVEEFIEKNRATVESSIDVLQKYWDSTAESFFSEITKDFETGYPDTIKQIEARVSMVPIFPRNVHEWWFNVSYRSTETGMKMTAIHEMIHFFWFKKWLEIMPDYDKRKFDGPHSEWKLSEIVVISIINNNPVFQEIIGGNKQSGYMEFQNIEIGDKGIFEYFADIYREHLQGKISFEDFIRKSWDEYQKNREIIEVK